MDLFFGFAGSQILGVAIGVDNHKGKFLGNTFKNLIQSANDEILAMCQNPS